MRCVGGGGVFVQAEDGVRDLVRSRGLGDVYKRQVYSNRTGGAQPQFERRLWLPVSVVEPRHSARGPQPEGLGLPFSLPAVVVLSGRDLLVLRQPLPGPAQDRDKRRCPIPSPPSALLPSDVVRDR